MLLAFINWTKLNFSTIEFHDKKNVNFCTKTVEDTQVNSYALFGRVSLVGKEKEGKEI